MRKKFYLPTRIADRALWLQNFNTKIGGYATAFGISTTETGIINAFTLFYVWLAAFLGYLDEFKQSVTQFKNILSSAPVGTPLGTFPTYTPPTMPTMPTQSGLFNFISGIAKRIKAQTSIYTTAIGEDLGIIGDEWDFDPDTFVPPLTSKLLPDGVKLITEKSQTDGTNFYGSINGGGWVLLGRDNTPPYVDTRPLTTPGVAEQRSYKCRGVITM